LKLWVCASEALPVSLVRRFYQALPNARLLNLYGSSEDAGDVTWYDTRDLPKDATTVPVGRPMANTTAYVLDQDLNQLPIHLPGEIYIGGANLAIGYHNPRTSPASASSPTVSSWRAPVPHRDLGSFQPMAISPISGAATTR
jgi:non-ribosomal peptide synthetase component F